MVLGLAGCGSSHGVASNDSHVSDPVSTLVNSATVAPGGGEQSGSVVARVGNAVITKSALDGRMAIVAQGESPPENIIPVPPDFTACISRLAEYDRKSGNSAAATATAQLKKTCAALYEKLLKNSLEPLISGYWVIGGAAEDGLVVSDQSTKQLFSRAAQKQFRSAAKFRSFLAATGQNVPNLLFDEKVEILAGAIREKVYQALPPVTAASVARYYDENKPQFAVNEQRDLGILHTKNAATANQIKRELQAGVSFASIAKRLGKEQPVYTREGLLPGLEPHAFAEKSLNDAIFSAKGHVVSGPIRVDLLPGFHYRTLADIRNINGYYIFEVEKIDPAHQETLAQVKATITQELPRILQRQAIAAYIKGWRARWRAKTDCSAGYVVRKCRQFKPSPTELPEDAYTVN